MKKKAFLITLSIFITAVIVIILAYGAKLLKESFIEPTYDTVTIERSSDFYEIKAEYPRESLDKDNIMKTYVTNLVEERMTDWEVGGEIYNAEQAVAQEFPDRPKMVYTLNILYQKFNSSDLDTVSYLFIVEEYTGGANGIINVQTFTFDSNGLVEVEDVLNLAGETINPEGLVVYNDLALSKLIFEQTTKNEELFPNSEITQEGLGLAYLKDDGVSLDLEKCHCDGWFYGANLQNFVLTNEGISFFYGKCDITICASGVVQVSLDWKTLAPYLVAID